MKLKYIGPTFYTKLSGLTNGKVYECLGVEYVCVRVIDDSGEDYLYGAANPEPMNGSTPPGRWEVIEDDDKQTLYRACILHEFDEIPEPDEFDIN